MGAKDKGAGGEAGPLASRRDFLSIGIGGALAVIAAAFLWPVYRLASRRGNPKSLVYFDAAALGDMPEAGVKKAELNVRGGDRPDTRVFIKRDASGRLTAFSAVCTHLSCLVNYNYLKGEFICPCHGGVYDSDGNVKSGPPPAPMTRLPVRVAGDKIQVGFKI